MDQDVILLGIYIDGNGAKDEEPAPFGVALWITRIGPRASNELYSLSFLFFPPLPYVLYPALALDQYYILHGAVKCDRPVSPQPIRQMDIQNLVSGNEYIIQTPLSPLISMIHMVVKYNVWMIAVTQPL